MLYMRGKIVLNATLAHAGTIDYNGLQDRYDNVNSFFKGGHYSLGGNLRGDIVHYDNMTPFVSCERSFVRTYVRIGTLARIIKLPLMTFEPRC